jgi:hypothetical protein
MTEQKQEQTPQEKALGLSLNVRDFILNKAAQCMQYANWSEELIASKMTEARAKIIKDVGSIDFHLLSVDELKSIGFSLWDEETSILLAPLWAYDLLPVGQEMHCISGKSIVVAPDYKSAGSEHYIDNDIRFGCISYGFKVA